jgi:hypothetical protein
VAIPPALLFMTNTMPSLPEAGYLSFVILNISRA